MPRFLFACALAALPFAAEAHDLGDPVFLGAGLASLVASGPSGSVVVESPPSAVQDAFDTVIFHGSLPDPRVRIDASREEDGDWGPWLAAELHREPGGRYWGRVRLDQSKAGRLKLRVVTLGAEGTAPMSVVGVESFLRGPEPRGPESPPSKRSPPRPLEERGFPSDLPGPPPIIPRSEWGARPPKSPPRPEEPLRLTLHHTSGPQPMGAAEALAEMRFIQKFHQDGRGWDDVAYHYVIDGAGRIYQGRPETAVGAHTRNNNAGNIGICLMGDFQPPSKLRPTNAQLQSVIRLGRYLRLAFGIPASTLRGHRDYVDTDCPGDRAYSKLDALRSAIASDPPPPASRPLLQTLKALSPRFD